MQSVELGNRYTVLGIIDSNPNKWNDIFYSYEIYSPEVLKKEVFDSIVILSDEYVAIRKKIESLLGKNVKIHNKNYFFENEIMDKNRKSNDEEIQSILQYVEKNGLDIFNYPFVCKYNNMEVDVRYDEISGLYYVMHKSMKMYMKRSLKNVEEVKAYYHSLQIEQDIDSPHHYLDKTFEMPQGSIVADVGAAEGIFTLDNIDYIKRAYLFECDDEWIEALQRTFRPYKSKIEIVKKYVSDYVDDKCIRLDEYKNCGINFIKMDIDGAECSAIEGAKDIIMETANMKCAICSYHSDYDEQAIRWLLSQYGMITSTTDGYMWFPYDIKNKKVSTKLVRGIVRGIKSS